MDRKEDIDRGPWFKQEDDNGCFYYNDYYNGSECRALKEYGFTDEEIREIEEQTREKRLSKQREEENEKDTSEFYRLMHEKTKEKAKEIIIDYMKSEYGFEDSDLEGDFSPFVMAADLSARVLAIVQELDKAIEITDGVETYESLYEDIFPSWVTDEIFSVLVKYGIVSVDYNEIEDYWYNLDEPEPPDKENNLAEGMK